MQKLNWIIALALLGVSCKSKPTFNYQHAEKEQVLMCTGIDQQLLNEALYTFEDDLLHGYGGEENQLVPSYGRFLYTGFSGTAQLEQFASPHAIKIKEALVAEGIITEGGVKSNLNYEHPAVQCIIDKIEDKELAQTINALIDTQTMDPKLFNSRMRNFGRKAPGNRYEAVYVALDTYYQQLTVARPADNIDE